VQVPYEVQEEREALSPLMVLLQETALFLWKEWPRNMQGVGHDINGNFTMTGVCPHCRRDAVFVRITNNYTIATVGQDKRGYPINRLAAALQCQGCKELILGCVNHTGNSKDYAYHLHYPLAKPDDRVAPEIPQHIQPDFREALRCLWVDAYNATGEMCRRAIEASCVDLGAPKKEVLEDMIDWLEEKRIITPGLKEVAHKVRLGGNRCAHPNPATQDSAQSPQANLVAPIEKIEKEHAVAIVDFTRHFFQYVYVTPKQLDKYDFSKPKAVKKP